MTDKGLGFIHNITLTWLDAAAESRLRNDNVLAMRRDLEQVVSRDVKGDVSRRKTIDVLVGIWQKNAFVDKDLHSRAMTFFPTVPSNERVWLHYGLALLYYPFFRQTAAVIGQFARTGEPITRQAVKGRLASELGHLGSLNRASERIVASLVDWGCLEHKKKGNLYAPKLQSFITSNNKLQIWFLTCALSSHPADHLPFPDLIRLPELFPFRISITIDSLRVNNRFNVQRQGAWDMVGLVASNSNGL